MWCLRMIRQMNGPWPDSPEGIVQSLREKNPDALLLEPREFYDAALLGITDFPHDNWPRKLGVWVAVYDADLCIQATLEMGDCSEEEAIDWFYTNTSGGWLGSGTPTFRWTDLDTPKPTLPTRGGSGG